MDAMKLAGLSMSAGLTALVIVTASPGTLAVLDVALVAALYVIRNRRQYASTHARQLVVKRQLSAFANRAPERGRLGCPRS